MLTPLQIGFLKRAVEIAQKGMLSGKGGPFGCVIVKEGKIIAEAYNEVTSSNDPTAHAEVVAIREACRKLNTYQLTGCDVYASCEPCPMCLGAVYWARAASVTYANTRYEAAAIDFDDDFIFREIQVDNAKKQIPFQHYPLPEAAALFEQWVTMTDKRKY